MNENSKSFYPRDMFKFIHHPKYGCYSPYGLTPKIPSDQKLVDCCLGSLYEEK
jgi:hypothetical protein